MACQIGDATTLSILCLDVSGDAFTSDAIILERKRPLQGPTRLRLHIIKSSVSAIYFSLASRRFLVEKTVEQKFSLKSDHWKA